MHMRSSLPLTISLLLFLQTFAYGGQAGPTLTIYNANLALVCERRTVQLAAGVQEILYPNVPAQLDPSSVQASSTTSPRDVSLLQQRFVHDASSADRLLASHLNADVVISMAQGQSLAGTLLSMTGSDPVIRDTDGTLHVIKSGSIQSIHLTSSPPGLVTKPSLIWTMACTKSGTHEMQTTYLTQGISWQAEYVATLNASETHIDLHGRASVENRSGATFQNASLRLVAGDVHRPLPPQFFMRSSMLETARAPSRPTQPEQRSLFEYHVYELQHPATLLDRETLQVELLTVPPLHINKVYIFDSQLDAKHVIMRLHCLPAPGTVYSGPLPAGKVRIYKRDKDSSMTLLGEDLVNHTPAGESLLLEAGKVFDVVAERTVKEVIRVGQNSRRETIEVCLSNRKMQDITVVVVEHFTGSWELLGDSPPVKKKTARTVHFEVAVPRAAKKTADYTLIYKD